MQLLWNINVLSSRTHAKTRQISYLQNFVEIFEVHNEYRGSFNRYLVLAWIGTCYPQIRCQVFESPFSCHNFDYIIREIAI